MAATGKITHLTDLDGMMLYKVTSLAFDPSTRTAFYVNQNYAYRDINAIDVDTGKKRRLLTDARIGDLAFDNGIRVHELAPVQASLEEAFMELTKDSVEYHAGVPGQPHPKAAATQKVDA